MVGTSMPFRAAGTFLIKDKHGKVIYPLFSRKEDSFSTAFTDQGMGSDVQIAKDDECFLSFIRHGVSI